MDQNQPIWVYFGAPLRFHIFDSFHRFWRAIRPTSPLVASFVSSVSVPDRSELNYSSWSQWNRTSICLLRLTLRSIAGWRWMSCRRSQMYHWSWIWGSKHLCLYLGSANQHSGTARTPDFEIPQGGAKVYPDITHSLNNLLSANMKSANFNVFQKLC